MWKLVLPEADREKALAESHNTLQSGHLGVDKTFAIYEAFHVSSQARRVSAKSYCFQLVFEGQRCISKNNPQVISMYFFLSFPMVLLVSQNFSILISKKHKRVISRKTIFLIVFLTC